MSFILYKHGITGKLSGWDSGHQIYKKRSIKTKKFWNNSLLKKFLHNFSFPATMFIHINTEYWLKLSFMRGACDEGTLKKNLVEVNPLQSWPWKQKGSTVVAAAMKLWTTEEVLQINILKKSYTMNPNHLHLQEMYVTITILEWLVSIWCMFDRNVRGKATQTECLFELNLGSFGYFEYTTALWLLLEPSCKGNLLTRVTQHFRARRSPDPKNRAFEKNGSCIQILDTILYMDSINQLFCMFCMFFFFVFPFFWLHALQYPFSIVWMNPNLKIDTQTH